MAAFIGRYEELSRLDEVYNCNIRNCYINAKPRSGATALVKRFCEKSKCIYTTFHESTPNECVNSFRIAIEDFSREPISTDTRTFADLFHILSGYVKEYDPILVFDGTNYAPDEFAAQVKWFSENNECMIILIGDDDCSRYDFTFTDKIDLGDMTMVESCLMHPKMTRMDALKTYMAVGGKPLYHTIMNKADFASSAEKAFLGNFPKLCAETELILRKSSVPYIMCCAILSDIANFTGRPVDIADMEGISRQLCDIYLKKLTEEGLIKTLTPMGDAPKKPVYIIDNPLVAFYFIAVRMNPEVEFTEGVSYKDIEHNVDMFMELRFRDVCEDYIRKHYECKEIGRWWVKDENTSKPTLVAIADIDGTERAIIADCKFREGKLDTGALKAFMARAEDINDVPEKRYIIFSISGFEDKLVKKAKSENILLVGPDELLGIQN